MIESLRSVSLDDLTAATTLLTRVDNKYVVPAAALGNLVEALDLPVLEVAGRREFRYESVYFDTPDWVAYLAAARGRRRRWKVRTRTYVDSGTCLLEFKARGYRGQTVKERIGYDPDDGRLLNAAATEFLADRVDGLAGSLEAALTTTYRRSTLVDLTNHVRVTIDTGVACTAGSAYRAVVADHVIVETKSATGSGAADRLLWRSGFRPESISKYAIGVAALYPELPRNKWARTLRRYVTTSQDSGSRP